VLTADKSGGGYTSEDESQFILARIDEQKKNQKDNKGISTFLWSSFVSVRDSMALGNSNASGGNQEEIDWGK
jgi:hypothetical protein